MSSKLTAEEFVAKVEWEGGVLQAMYSGLRSTDLDDDESELWEKWYELEDLWYVEILPLVKDIEKILEDSID